MMTQERYDELVAEYRARRAHMSFVVYGDPAYRELSEDPSIVDKLLKSLDKGEAQGFQFSLLYHHTGATPWCDNDRGYYGKIRDRWLSWGRERGII